MASWRCREVTIKLKLWETASGRVLRSFVGHAGWVTSVAFSPDGKLALSGSEDSTLKLWEVGGGRELKSFAAAGMVTSVAFSPNGKLALSGSDDAIMRLWNVTTGRELRSFPGQSKHDDPQAFFKRISSVTFSPDGKLALSGSEDEDAAMRLWNVTTGRELRTFAGNTRAKVYSVAFSPDGRFALSGNSDNTLKL
jgi:dipeptidyl aminopeptidase/acylaminoacyl peptidase